MNEANKDTLLKAGNVVMHLIFLAALVSCIIFLLCGCTAVNSVAEGLSRKTISGSGAVSYSRVGLDQQTQTPEMVGLFVWGDYTSGHQGSEVFRMEESEDASIFNADAITKKKKVFFMTSDQKRMDAVVEKLTEK